MAFNLGDILVNIKANTDGLQKGLGDVQNMGEQTKSLGQKIQTGMNVAAAGLAVVGAGLTAFSKGAVSFTEDLVKSSKALGTQIGVSTTEASRLSAAMQRMGIDAQSTQTMFGIFAKKINEAANTTDAQRIAQEGLSLQLRQAQKDIDTTTAAIAKHGDADGSLALKVETLKNKMAGLQDQMAASSNGLQQLGISTVDADGKQKSFTQILGETADKFKDMPNGVTKTALAMDLFGRSGKDMIKVLNLGSSGIDELEKNADKLGLTLNANTIARINDLVKAQKDLKEQTDAMKIAVGTATAPLLTAFDKMVNKVVSSLIGADSPLKGVTTGFLAFGGPVAGAASALLGFVANLDQALPIIMAVAGALSWWMLIAVAVVAALAFIVIKLGGFKKVWGDILTVIKPVADMIWGILKPAFEALANSVVNILWPALKKIYDFIQPYLLPILLAIGAVLIGPLVASVAVFVGAIWLITNALNIAIQVAQWLFNNVIMPGINIAVAVFSALWTVVSTVFNAIASVVGVVVGIVIGYFNLLYTVYSFIFQTIYAIAVWVWQGIWNTIKPVLDSIVGGIQWVGNVINGIWQWIWGVAGPVFGAIGGAAAGAWNYIVSVFSGAVGWFGGIWNGIVNAARSAFGGLGNVLGGAWDGMKNGFKSALNWIIDQANKLIRAYNNSVGRIPGTPNIGQIPGFAKGTENFAGGGAIVGEQGAELGLFPSGTKIIPHNLTANLVDNLMSVGDMLRTFLSAGAGAFLAGNQLNPALAGGSSPNITSSTTIQGDINIGSQQDADYLLQRLDRNVQLESMGVTPHG